MVIFCAESWAFEVIQITTGYIGAVEQAGMVVLMAIGTFMIMFAGGQMEGIASLVGHATGANKPELAFRIFKVSTIVSFSSSLLMMATVFLFRVQVVELFTTSPEVVEKVLDVMPLLCFMFIFDSF
jgi:Na+-driven multidrug efflux pump